MPFLLNIPRSGGASFILPIEAGETVFVLGANGTGKSGLMTYLYRANQEKAHRISAHRQTWFPSSAISLSPEQRRTTAVWIRSSDSQTQSRWKEDHSSERANIAIYDLVDAENVRARSIANAVDAENITMAQNLSKKDAPIKIINELLRLSNIAIEISVIANEQVVASKNGGPNYSIAELSDGERNAILIAASVLTVKPGTLILVDEPERHLHRSIISPLLTLLFEKRKDCAFVVSTHEVMLSIDNPSAKTLLVRGCGFNGSEFAYWDADLLERGGELDEDLRHDILGSRRKILFIEGEPQSLDKPIYSLIFPNVTVISKASCRDVEHATTGIRASEHLHWLSAFGIVDNDRRTTENEASLREKGIYALSVYAVESIYYHPEIQRRVATRHSVATGEVADDRIREAKAAALSSIQPHAQRMSERAVEKYIRDLVMSRLPKRQDISRGTPFELNINIAEVVEGEHNFLNQAVANGDLTCLISKYPIRETPALDLIASRLGFQSRSQYEGAVRKLLSDDEDALIFTRSLFGNLWEDITTA